MCSSQIRKPSLMSPEMLAAYEAKGKSIEKLPTYSSGTGEKRFKHAQTDYAKEHPIPQKHATFSDDVLEQSKQLQPTKLSNTDKMRKKVAELKRFREENP